MHYASSNGYVVIYLFLLTPYFPTAILKKPHLVSGHDLNIVFSGELTLSQAIPDVISSANLKPLHAEVGDCIIF